MKVYFSKFISALKYPIMFASLFWIVFFINSFIFAGKLNAYGVFPRNLHGLYGIFFSPFLHGSIQHILGNTLFFLLLSWVICFLSINLWVRTLIFGTILGGLFTWVFGSSTFHIGASGLVFALWGTILGMAIHKRHPYFILATIVLLFSYGFSFVWGLIPQDGVSLAGHVGGLLAGLACSHQVEYNNKIK